MSGLTNQSIPSIILPLCPIINGLPPGECSTRFTGIPVVDPRRVAELGAQDHQRLSSPASLSLNVRKQDDHHLVSHPSLPLILGMRPNFPRTTSVWFSRPLVWRSASRAIIAWFRTAA